MITPRFAFEMRSELNEFDDRRGQGSNPRSGLKFSGLSSCCLSSAKMRRSNSFISLRGIE